jgi:phage terminase large subunit GpA-like protein
MNQPNVEASQLTQEATGFYNRSIQVNQEATRLLNESIRLSHQAKTALFGRSKLLADADRLLTEGKKMREYASELIEEGHKLIEQSKKLKSNELVANYVTNRCQHCDTGIEFNAAELDERNNIVVCPHCGLETKLHIPQFASPQCEQNFVDDKPQLPVRTSQQNTDLEKIRYSARNLVESHWRNFLALIDVDKKKAMEAPHTFDATLNMMMEHMPASDASLFRSVIEEERDKLSKEYWQNPAALKARLGVRNQTPTFTHNQHGLDDLVVRTAVRATIWQSIREVFRLFR